MLVSHSHGTRTDTRKARARLGPQVIAGVMRLDDQVRSTRSVATACVLVILAGCVSSNAPPDPAATAWAASQVAFAEKRAAPQGAGYCVLHDCAGLFDTIVYEELAPEYCGESTVDSPDRVIVDSCVVAAFRKGAAFMAVYEDRRPGVGGYRTSIARLKSGRFVVHRTEWDGDACCSELQLNCPTPSLTSSSGRLHLTCDQENDYTM